VRLPFGAPRRTALRAARAAGLAVLEQAPPEELALGVTGRFWQLWAPRLATDPQRSREPAPAGGARVARSFSPAAAPEGRTRLAPPPSGPRGAAL